MKKKITKKIERTSKPVVEKVHISFDVDVSRLLAASVSETGRAFKRELAAILVESDMKIWERGKVGKKKTKRHRSRK